MFRVRFVSITVSITGSLTRLMLVAGVGLYGPNGLAASCDEIVSDTVAEMRAGAGAAWSEAGEELVRRSAGAACVKARSTRYEAPQTNPDEPDTVPGEPTASSEIVDESPGEAADDGSWTFGGLKFRSNNGSPGQKPYERQRSNAEDE